MSAKQARSVGRREPTGLSVRWVAVIGCWWLLGYAGVTWAVSDWPTGRLLVGHGLFNVSSTAAAVLAVQAMRRTSSSAWRFGAVGACLLAVGDWSYTAYPLLGGPSNPYPSVADLFYVLGALAVLLALVQPFRAAAPLRQARAGLDGLLVALGVATLLGLPLLQGDGTASLLQVVLQVFYPGLTAATFMAWASLGPAGHRDVPLSFVLLGAMVGWDGLVGVVQVLAGPGYTGYVAGGYTDLLMQVEPLLLAAAAVAARRPVAVHPVSIDRELGVLALVVGAAPVLAVAAAATWQGRASHGCVLLVGAVFALLAARMLASVADGRRIGRALDAALLEREELASTDALTGLRNRRVFDTQMRQLLAQAQASGEDVGLVVVDLDHFKEVNDRYGHPAGDEVLRAVADRLRLVTRDQDVLARYGGEEFALIAPQTSTADLVELAERLRDALRTAPVQHGSTRSLLTASLGAAGSAETGFDPDALLLAADRALYRAKAAGRDRTVLHAAQAGADGATGDLTPETDAAGAV